MARSGASLSAVPSNRRKGPRESSLSRVDLNCTFQDAVLLDTAIVSVSLGRVVVSVRTEGSQDCKIGKIGPLRIEGKDEVIVDGDWLLSSFRISGSNAFLTFELQDLDVLSGFGDAVSPDVLLRSSRFRFFNLNAEAHLLEVGQLFTAMVDFPFPIKCWISYGQNRLLTRFDFSSGGRSLEELQFYFETPPVGLSEELPVVVEFSFFGIKYLLKSVSKKYDVDFGILPIKLPMQVLAVSARRFDRYECDVECELIGNGEEVLSASLKSISVAGGLLVVRSRGLHNEHGVIEIRIPSFGQSMMANFTVIGDGAEVRVRFVRDAKTKRAVSVVLSRVLPGPMRARDQTLYDQFLNLYASVGYAPKDASLVREWQDTSRETWRIQDSLFPGSSTGAFHKNQLVSSCSTLPISRKVAYGHSFCLIKSAQSASTILDQMIFSLACCELIPEVKTYAGSYAKNSKFTTRIHTVFELQARPEHQIIVNVTRFFFENAIAATSVGDAEVLPVMASEVLLAVTNKELASFLVDQHPALESFHSSHCFVVRSKDKDRILAHVIEHESIENFTAANVFHYVWVLLEEECGELSEIHAALRTYPDFYEKTFQFVLGSGRRDCGALELVGSKTVPAFWTFTPKDELGPLIGSMHRAVYAVLRKYGDEGLAEIERAFGS